MNQSGCRHADAGARPPAFSFEFFPPKNEIQEAALDATIAKLAPFSPHFVSVTYGAGGTSQERSFGTVRRLIEAGFRTTAHLTCAGASRDELAEAIRRFLAEGVAGFVALRGDPPGGPAERYRPHPEGFLQTADLVRALKDEGAIEVSVSAYPERHPHSPDWNSEIETLKRKVDAGADRAITQFFFDNDLYDAYLHRVRRAGIKIPVVPGIMPIHCFASVRGFAERCGATIPSTFASQFASLDANSETHKKLAIEIAAAQISDLRQYGCDAFHVYTLNRSELTAALCLWCGLQDNSARAAA